MPRLTEFLFGPKGRPDRVLVLNRDGAHLLDCAGAAVQCLAHSRGAPGVGENEPVSEAILGARGRRSLAVVIGATEHQTVAQVLPPVGRRDRRRLIDRLLAERWPNSDLRLAQVIPAAGTSAARVQMASATASPCMQAWLAWLVECDCALQGPFLLPVLLADAVRRAPDVGASRMAGAQITMGVVRSADAGACIMAFQMGRLIVSRHLDVEQCGGPGADAAARGHALSRQVDSTRAWIHAQGSSAVAMTLVLEVLDAPGVAQTMAQETGLQAGVGVLEGLLQRVAGVDDSGATAVSPLDRIVVAALRQPLRHAAAAPEVWRTRRAASLRSARVTVVGVIGALLLVVATVTTGWQWRVQLAKAKPAADEAVRVAALLAERQQSGEQRLEVIRALAGPEDPVRFEALAQAYRVLAGAGEPDARLRRLLQAARDVMLRSALRVQRLTVSESSAQQSPTLALSLALPSGAEDSDSLGEVHRLVRLIREALPEHRVRAEGFGGLDTFDGAPPRVAPAVPAPAQAMSGKTVLILVEPKS